MSITAISIDKACSKITNKLFIKLCKISLESKFWFLMDSHCLPNVTYLYLNLNHRASKFVDSWPQNWHRSFTRNFSVHQIAGSKVRDNICSKQNRSRRPRWGCIARGHTCVCSHLKSKGRLHCRWYQKDANVDRACAHPPWSRVHVRWSRVPGCILIAICPVNTSSLNTFGKHGWLRCRGGYVKDSF